MRKQGLVFLIVVIAIVFLVNSVVTDRWLERRLERFGSRLNGAKVELDRVDFSTFGLSLSWERLQVADPDDTWTNLFETGPCALDLALEPLLKRKFLVEDFDMQDLRFGTQRDTDGRLPKGKEAKSIAESRIVQSVRRNMEAEIERYPLLNLGVLRGQFDMESVWDAAALETPGRIALLEESLAQKYEDWEERMEHLPGEAEIAALQRDIDSIQVERIATPQEARSSFDLLQSVRERAEGYYATVQQISEDFNQQRADLAGLQAEMAGWVEEDYRRLLSIAGLPELSRESIARMLFGERFSRRMEKVLSVMGKVRTYSRKVGKYIPAKELPPRGTGQDIRFVREQDYPGFWIKRMRLTGEASGGTALEGSVLHVVSNQVMIDKPTTLFLEGKRSGGAGFAFSGLIDSRGERPHEQFGLEMRGLSLKGQTLTDFPLLPYTLSEGTATVLGSIDFEGSDFLAEVQFRGSGIDFDTSQRPEMLEDEELYRLSIALVQKINEVQFTALLRQSGEDFKMDLRSNLDDLVLSSLEEVVSEEFRQVQEELESRIEDEIGAPRSEVEALIAERESSLENKIAGTERLIKEQLDRVDQKRREIDARLKAEEEKLRKQVETELERQGEKAGEKARDLIDSLFK